MKTLFRMAIAFVVGSALGATRGLNKMKTEALSIATQMYVNSMEMMLSGGIQESDGQGDGRKENASVFLSGQFLNFKETAKEQASQSIKDQIDKIFD